MAGHVRKYWVHSGERYGRWLVLEGEEWHDKREGTYWVMCRCDCGTEQLVRVSQLARGLSHSCGCYSWDVNLARVTTHGGCKTRLYGIWHGIKARCSDESAPQFPHYSGRGIGVCVEWRDSFEAFRDWSLANGYQDDLTIDRRNNHGDYTPENCRWVTMTVNARNRRNNRILTAFGETKTVSEWVDDERCTVTIYALCNRINKLGWSDEEAIATPLQTNRWLRRRKTLT